MSYEEFPALHNVSMMGVSGPALQDTFIDPLTSNVTTSVACVTTFQPSCSAIAATNFTQNMTAQYWDIALDDGYAVRVDYTVAIPRFDQIWPLVRIVPVSVSLSFALCLLGLARLAILQITNQSGQAQPRVPYLTLLALWNVTDSARPVYNTVHTNLNTNEGENLLALN
jgi:hypothetical protein